MPETDGAGRSPLIVVERWRRYGHDRAYVRIDDADAGFRDLKTGELHCTRPDQARLVAEVTDRLVKVETTSESAWYSGRHAAEPGSRVKSAVTPVGNQPTVAAPATPHVDSPLQPDRDLALTPPGIAARTQAVALRDAAPIHTFLSRALGMKTDERSWRIGADAEVEVARRLEQLDPRWRVLHAIPVGERGSDIDHLVIGPAGVFTINTKHHPDANIWVRGETFKVNGQNQYYVRNSRHEAHRAAKLLSAKAFFDIEVLGIIAVMGAHKGFTIKAQPADGAVKIMTRRDVTKHLDGLPEVLGMPSIERIYEVARHLATWQPGTVQWQDF
jgi:hypothetical protein